MGAQGTNPHGEKNICGGHKKAWPPKILTAEIFEKSKKWASSCFLDTMALPITFKWACLPLPALGLLFWGCGGPFCEIDSLLLQHHILKKCKCWSMLACNLLLAWPQTSGEQAGNVFGMPWLLVLGPQCPSPPWTSDSQPPQGAPQSRLFGP